MERCKCKAGESRPWFCGLGQSPTIHLVRSAVHYAWAGMLTAAIIPALILAQPHANLTAVALASYV